MKRWCADAGGMADLSLHNVAGRGPIQGPELLLNHKRAGVHVESRPYAGQGKKKGGVL